MTTITLRLTEEEASNLSGILSRMSEGKAPLAMDRWRARYLLTKLYVNGGCPEELEPDTLTLTDRPAG